jgi:hypothetical protein
MSTGSVLLVREDKKPLHLAHVDALLEFLAELQPEAPPGLSGMALEQRVALCKARGDKLVTSVSRDGFEQYFLTWMEEVGCEKYGEVPSPYHV